MLKKNPLITQNQLFVTWLCAAISLALITSYVSYSDTGHWRGLQTYNHPILFKSYLDSIGLKLTGTNITLIHVIIAGFLFYTMLFQIISMSYFKAPCKLHRVVGRVCLYALVPLFLIASIADTTLVLVLARHESALCVLIVFSIITSSLAIYYAIKKEWRMHVSFVMTFLTILATAPSAALIEFLSHLTGSSGVVAAGAPTLFISYSIFAGQFLAQVAMISSKKSRAIEWVIAITLFLGLITCTIIFSPHDMSYPKASQSPQVTLHHEE